ncbi:HlyD family secretion protein [Algoriphagus sp. 4150]|uniref:HlyD family secretion protein n=1 Tax=Algoriphagus sp. 4150 TaxID=2817756 RepID=UPI00285C889A|nr:biotin/lipoyl-binding protein [Algoriphagus sp. 4150]MDR7132466.1 HlyD family secretion protein [Algoriphagus sp. 4150]
MQSIYQKSGIYLLLLGFTACMSPKEEILEGRVKRETVTVVTKYPGRVDRVYVHEGQEVGAGDTLAVLDFPEVKAKLSQAEGALTSAEAQYRMAINGATHEQLRQAVANVEGYEEQYLFAEKAYRRMEAMYSDSLISSQQFDEVNAKYKGAKAQHDAAQAKLEEVKKGVRNEQVQMALGQYERAKGAKEEANVAWAERYVTAPKAFRVETISVSEGELAMAGYPIFTGFDHEKVYLRLTIPETKVGDFPIGKELKAKATAVGQEVSVRVVSIKQLTRYADKTTNYPGWDHDQSQYELKLEPQEKLDPNKWLSGSRVLINEVENAK